LNDRSDDQEQAPSAITNRTVDLAAEILGDPDPNELRYLHTVLAQCGLPYRAPSPQLRDYIRKNGVVSLVVTSGYLTNPETGDEELQGIPYGAKSRLLMIHLCTEAILRQSATVPIQDSMSAFMKSLGMSVTGGKKGSITLFKEQLNRLAAAQIKLGIRYETEAGYRAINQRPAPLIAEYDVWFPKHPNQRMLWSSTVTLSNEFFDSLRSHALPLDPRAIRSLQSSAMALDIYTWLAHRLPRVKSPNGDPVSWEAIKGQFGQEFRNAKRFRQDFREALAKVIAVYRKARIESAANGLRLRLSPPPISRTWLEGKLTK
jgi:hypothetical protein